MSWKPEVQAGDNTWTPNGLRFETKEESDAYAAQLARRWLLVTDKRSVECEDPVNAEFDIATEKLFLKKEEDRED